MGLYSRYIFPRLLDWTLSTPYIQKQRRRALETARGSVLEIGFGTALNLPHYPEQVARLTVIDSERLMADRVAARVAKSRVPVEQMQLDAGGRLPFDDGSFDCVVTTFTLCSIDRVMPALLEIRRVLKRDGRYIFLEHGRSDDARVARRQDLFNPLQKLLACGCNINRPIDRLIQEAGLGLGVCDRFQMPDTPRILGEMYRGVAGRREAAAAPGPP